MNKIDPKVIEILKQGSAEDRVYICDQEPIYFGIYHFPEFFFYPLAPFHFDFCEDYKRLMKGEIDADAWIAFRESAKTSWKKILIAHAICYKKKEFINYDSYDKENAEAAIFDVNNWLQTKDSLIEDYGELISKSKKQEKGQTQKINRINKFITNNGIMVEAHSTQEPVRGRVFNEKRPDWIIFDDLETNKTKDSRAIINSIIGHVNEARTGIAAHGSMSFLCNLIVDDGVVRYIMDALRDNPRAVVRNIPAVHLNGEIAWPGKYVKTDAEAIKANADITDIKKRKISLQQKKRDLKPEVYEPEMMNNPAGSGDLFFNRRAVDHAIAKAEEPQDIIGGLKLWGKYNPSHKYGGGADTAEGIGADSNASVFIDFSMKPNLMVATFEDNDMAPNIFGTALRKQGNYFGGCFLIPEINNTGYATVAQLLSEEYYLLYQREVKNKTTEKLQKEWGWKATVGTKWEVLGNFKEAFENGDLIILDRGLLEEMRLFRKADARLVNREKGATKHFDKLRAAALAWHAREHAELPPEQRKKKYQSPLKGKPYEP